MATSHFNLKSFVENPNYQHLVNMRKVDWASITNHYDILITTSVRKEQLKNVTVEALVEAKILDEEVFKF